MTRETVKRLYTLYKENGNDKALKDLVSKRPWVEREEALKKATPPPPKVVKKEVKEDGKKSKG